MEVIQMSWAGLANMMLVLMERYAVSNGHLSEDEARAWVEEQIERLESA